MSETPRSDSAWHEARHGEDGNALYSEAQKMEREIAQLKQQLEELKKSERDARIIFGETWRASVEKVTHNKDFPITLLNQRCLDLVAENQEIREQLEDAIEYRDRAMEYESEAKNKLMTSQLNEQRLREALVELIEATESASLLRVTSCGKKLADAEDRETNAYLQARSISART